jgi:ABC-type phosphate/phosphonate transport system substrate-binding protein
MAGLIARACLNRQNLVGVGLIGVLIVALSAEAPEAQAEKASECVQIGIAQSLFRDIPQPLVKACVSPFRALMQAQTGLSCDMTPPTDAFALGEKLTKNEIQLAVFQGFEFAWVLQKNPDLKPLVIAVNKHRNRQAHLIVRQDSKLASISDLKGKELAIPRRSRDHCRLFLDRHCQECGQPMGTFFTKISESLNVEEALDAVVDNSVQVVVVDDVALECYQRRKPGRFEQLKDLLQSEAFPDTVVVFHAGFYEEALLQRCRDGLIKADSTALGRQMLTLWLMTAFEKIPDNYGQMLVDIAKAYPPPSAPVKLSSGRAD